MLKIIGLRFAQQLIQNVTKLELRLATSTSNAASVVGEAVQSGVVAAKKINEKNNPSQTEFPVFTAQQQQKILDILNKKSVQEMVSHGISKSRATKLTAWQKLNGPLQSVRDILMVEGFGMRMVEKFYRSLLEEPSPVVKKPAQRRTAPFITPSISAEQQQSIHSCVAVRIGVSSVTWARLELPPEEENSPCLLTHWQHHEITEKKLHLNDLVQRLLYVDHLIPAADCYLLENPQMAQISNNPGSAEQQNISIQKAQVTAILTYALRTRGRHEQSAGTESEKTKDATAANVFYLRRFLAARLFRQLVGTERVSSEDSILHLMRTHYNMAQSPEDVFERRYEAEHCANAQPATSGDLSFRKNVDFSQEQRHMFSHAERSHREFLGQALLINLAFIRLVLLQDAESIATVSRGSNKNKGVGDVEIGA